MVRYLASAIDAKKAPEVGNEELRPNRAAVCVMKYEVSNEDDVTRRANRCLSQWQGVVIENFAAPDNGADFSLRPETLARLHGALKPEGLSLEVMTEWQCT